MTGPWGEIQMKDSEKQKNLFEINKILKYNITAQQNSRH